MNLLSPEGVWGVMITLPGDGVDIENAAEGLARSVYLFSDIEKARAFAEKQIRVNLSATILLVDLLAAKRIAISIDMISLGGNAEESKTRRARRLQLTD